MSGKDIREGLAFLAVVVVAVVVWSFFRAPSPGAVTRVPVRIPQDQAFHPTGGLFDVSRDGLLMVYRRQSDDGGSELWARRFSDSDATPIRDTQRAGLPAISPDGREVAFTVAGDPARIRVAAVRGGVSTIIADSAAMGGVRWSPDGAWVYYTNASLGLSRVPAGGGAPEILTRIDASVAGQIHRGVDVLPGGRGVVFTEGVSPPLEARIKVLNVETGDVMDVTSGIFPRYSDAGYLLFMETTRSTLLAAPFDVESLELTGPALPVAAGLLRAGDRPLFALSQTGTLLYARPVGGPYVTPVWVERDGTAQQIDPGWIHRADPTYSGLALSPSGDRLAISIPHSGGTWDVWVKQLDAEGRALSRITSEGPLNYRPTWSPNGRAMTFISDRAGQVDLWTKQADGAGTAQRILDRPGVVRNAFYSPDGEWLVFREGEAPVADIFAVRPAKGAEPVPVVATRFGERSPALSPDGRWLAYSSEESGEWQVWVTRFLWGDSTRWQVSQDGGQGPVWAHSGRELFYRNASNELVAVQVDAGSSFGWDRGEVLFSMADYLLSNGRAQYDVSPDDQRFVMLRFADGGGMELVLLPDFFDGLQGRLGN